MLDINRSYQSDFYELETKRPRALSEAGTGPLEPLRRSRIGCAHVPCFSRLLNRAHQQMLDGFGVDALSQIGDVQQRSDLANAGSVRGEAACAPGRQGCIGGQEDRRA